MLRLATLLIAALCLASCSQSECMANCPDDRQVVCGTDDLTYDNSCHANCAGENVQYAGECTGNEDTVDQS